MKLPYFYSRTYTKNLETASLSAATASLLVTLMAVGAMSIIYGASFAIFGWWSLASVLAVSCGLTALAIFPIGFWHNKSLTNRINARWKLYVHGFSLAVAYALFYATLALLVALFIENAFKGITLDGLAVTCLAAIGSSITSYTLIRWARRLSAINVAQTMVGFLLIGVCASMILNEDPEWWRKNFSYLGSIDGNTFFIFSFTLIISGLLLLAITDYVVDDLRRLGSKNNLLSQHLQWLQVCFIGISLCMILLGLFPNVVGEIWGFLHNAAAKLLVVLFLALIFGIAWILPGLNRTFYVVSYLFGLVIGFMYFVLFGLLGYFNVTSFELFSFFVCIGWLYLLLQTISAKSQESR